MADSRALSKVGIISDSHGYEEPLEMVLERLDLHGVDAIYCLGDVVSGGQAVEATVRLYKDSSVGVVAGNHDREYAKEGDYPAEVKKFLSTLPRSRQFLVNGARYGVFHDNPMIDACIGRPPFQKDTGIKTLEQASYVFASMREEAFHIIFVGHAHKPRGWKQRGSRVETLDITQPIHIEDDAHYILGPGAISEPKVLTPHAVANPRVECDAHYGIFDVSDKKFSVFSFPLFRDGLPVEKLAGRIKPKNRADYV